jgi:anti-sigma factor RsiW
MPEHTQNGMPCHEFEALLSDALDGVLSGGELDRFQEHAQSCPACGPLLAEAEAGRTWLKGLTEVEPPASLVASILASTTGVDTQRLRVPLRATQPQISWLERTQAWLSGTFEPMLATIRQPRFAMSFGMAFFALSVGLTVAGVKPADLRQISLRPAAIRRTYYATQAKVVRSYENARIVYEFEARLREIRRNMQPAEPAPEKRKASPNDTTQQPEQREERNYSQTDHNYLLARAPLGPNLDDLPVVSVTTYRRFV